MKYIYQEISLNNVMTYFSDAFEVPKGQELIETKYYIDTIKGVVIFKLIVDDKEEVK